MTDLAPTPMEARSESPEIVHLTCCRETHPCKALCGWDVSREAEVGDELECVVCCDIADGFGPMECVHGGSCQPKDATTGGPVDDHAC